MPAKELYIKNMVCARCKSSVELLLQKYQAEAIKVHLGKVSFRTSKDFNLSNFAKDLKEMGFELIKNPTTKLVENLKILLIQFVQDTQNNQNFSQYLSDKTGKEYSLLSKSFKKSEGLTIEKYLIHLKIEKAKELIQMNELTFSEIAYQLNYSSVSHLSGQFKSVTGMTMTAYKKAQDWERSSLDKII